MPNLNKVQLMGNLTRDIELRYTPNGAAVAALGLAINRVWYNKETNEKNEETTFVDCEAWGKQAETLHQYVQKGQPIYLEGRLKLDQWQDKETGANRSKLKLVVEGFQFLPYGDKPAAGGQGSQPRSAPKTAPKERQPVMAADDDIPF